MEYKVYNSAEIVPTLQKVKIRDFLYENLEDSADQKEHILKAIDYAISPYPHQGGFVLVAEDNEKISGVVVMTKTGMEGFLPEYLMVYLAVAKEIRNQGIGEEIAQKALDMVHGNVALHVKPDNPAFHLYQKLGFVNEYLEMRLYKNQK